MEDSWQLLSKLKTYVLFDSFVPLLRKFILQIFSHMYTFAKSLQANFGIKKYI